MKIVVTDKGEFEVKYTKKFNKYSFYLNNTLIGHAQAEGRKWCAISRCQAIPQKFRCVNGFVSRADALNYVLSTYRPENLSVFVFDQTI